MKWLALVIACGGCDVVFDVTGYEAKCDLRRFGDDAEPRTIASASEFALSEDATLLVGTTLNGASFQMEDAASAPVDLGIYPSVAYAMTPEGDRLFLTSVADEPPRIQSEERQADGTWKIAGNVPAGVYASTPSAVRFGPRRVLARLSDAGTDVQEYVESDAATWLPIGPVLSIDSVFVPNLSPNALTMVYSTADGVFARQRDALDEDFGDATEILSGSHRSPVLSPACDSLFVVDSGTDLVGYP